MNNTNTLDFKAGTFFIKVLMVICVATLLIYLAKHFGTQYAEDKVRERLEASGLSPFVHYESLHFNPFELEASLDNVSLGLKDTPWLRLSRITLDYHPTQPTHLDIEFWIQHSPAETLSRDTQYWMRKVGINSLLGKGSLSANIEDKQITSQLHLDIKDAGRTTITSDIKMLNQNISLFELRNDLLVSMAMGQPAGVFIIHGDAIEMRSAQIQYEDMGLAKNTLPQPFSLSTIQRSINQLGFAEYGSAELFKISQTTQDFLQSEGKSLMLDISPVSPITLKDMALFAYDNQLFQGANMSLTTSPTNKR
ncbi:DUF2125 domain-containing protein [Marinomonas sp. C2222]|uniref:DUF2125 domain-containing protein n=1 Tax=Marinomonas sargassi TaxID=2984494 RepID=A0ABT2YP07_9GAMM|nr:DUF2125 domain-containing protein [Marinomonas sargassi]MCV2401617.1 DUF2125 domain-containing protein [Marinomonas sargassi]